MSWWKSLFGSNEPKPPQPPRQMPKLFSTISSGSSWTNASERQNPMQALTGADPNASSNTLERNNIGNTISKDIRPGAPRHSHIGINYEDGGGGLTSRVITIARIVHPKTSEGHVMLVAYCHMRNEIRHFRADRIRGFFNPETRAPFIEAALTGDPSAFLFGTKEQGSRPANFVGIRHKSDYGEEPERTISIGQIIVSYRSQQKRTILVAYCHEAGAIRSFRLDRISSFFDPWTDEPILNPKLNADPSALSIFRAKEIFADMSDLYSLPEFSDAISGSLIKSGWLAVLDYIDGKETLGCYQIAESGTTRAADPKLEIYRNDEAGSRQWGVSCEWWPTRTYGSLSNAAKRFLEIADEMGIRKS